MPDTEGVTNLPHYKNSRPENLSGSGKKIGVFFTKTIFAFPSGFIFRMIRPLNLEEFDGLLAGSTLRLIKNAARMLLISQLLLQLNHIMFHFTNRVFEAATRGRYRGLGRGSATIPISMPRVHSWNGYRTGQCSEEPTCL